ncbi:MAG: hypothetical protein QW480_02630 [Candidatus Aenigmatarchaeota archaeon]
MVEILEEILNEEFIQKNVNEGKKTFLNILELSKTFGEFKEIQRKIYISKKGEIITTSFNVKKIFNSISFLNFYVEIIAEEDLIKIYIKSSLNSALEQNEFLFNEFYINKYYPKLLEKARKISKEFIEKVKETL